MEEIFKKSIEVAEKTTERLHKDMDQTQAVFMWQNNLLKFYMENDIKQAIEYSKELMEEHGTILDPKDKCDLQFSLATSYVLEGSPELLEPARDLYKECLQTYDDPMYHGYIHNNLGMANFYNFVIKSSELTSPESAGIDALKPIIESFEESVYNLKMSIHAFEQFDTRFAPITNPNEQVKEVEYSMVKQKIFIDEFFDLKIGTGQVIPQDPKNYDMKNNHANEKFLA